MRFCFLFKSWANSSLTILSIARNERKLPLYWWMLDNKRMKVLGVPYTVSNRKQSKLMTWSRHLLWQPWWKDSSGLHSNSPYSINSWKILLCPRTKLRNIWSLKKSNSQDGWFWIGKPRKERWLSAIKVLQENQRLGRRSRKNEYPD